MIWKTPTSPLPRELLPRNQHATHHQASEKDRTTWGQLTKRKKSYVKTFRAHKGFYAGTSVNFLTPTWPNNGGHGA